MYWDFVSCCVKVRHFCVAHHRSFDPPEAGIMVNMPIQFNGEPSGSWARR